VGTIPREACMIWREKKILLSILGVLLVANAIFFFTYRVRYENRLKDLEDRVHQSEVRLTQARSMRLTAERRVTAYRQVQKDVQDIYNQNWATEDRRLLALIGEVKRLAVASNLIPKSTSYTRVSNTQVKRGSNTAEVVGISFTVQGDYQQVRRLINLLELSQQFVIIDQIALTSAENQNLTLTLRLKTLFRDTSTAAGRDL
jgi:Type II secretion system (T2SS), protein M subtype b